ncbi:MAG: hypothetical protein M3310_06575 [Actinomycetota bacterium]|nr:hypothetical protein [Actinomycetota bacterium]
MDVAVRIAFALAFAFVVLRSTRADLRSVEPFDVLLLLVVGDVARQVVAASGYSPTGTLLAGAAVACTTLALCRSTSPKPTSLRS